MSLFLSNYLIVRKPNAKSQIVIKSLESCKSNANYDSEKQPATAINSPNEMVCRVCMNPADISITEMIDNFQILSAIRSVANIVISHEDSFPKYICQNCLEDLKVAYKFKQRCESSDYKFRQCYSQDRKETKMTRHDFPLILRQMKKRRLVYVTQNQKSVADNKVVIKKPTELLTPEYTFTCDTCKIEFNSKEKMLEHRQKRDCIRQPCLICGKVVINLRSHMNYVHNTEAQHPCHICGKITKSATSRRNHMLMHSDEYAHCCPLCPYKAKVRQYLRMHMRTHTGEKPYLCSHCPATFSHQSNLKKHQLVHYSMKFECEECKKPYRCKSSLQDHYEAYHLNMRYRCNLCGRELWSRKKLLRHELRVHKREKHKLNNEVIKVIASEGPESDNKDIYALQNVANEQLLTEDICLIVEKEQMSKKAKIKPKARNKV